MVMLFADVVLMLSAMSNVYDCNGIIEFVTLVTVIFAGVCVVVMSIIVAPAPVTFMDVGVLAEMLTV